jgi:hypothetical protein
VLTIAGAPSPMRLRLKRLKADAAIQIFALLIVMNLDLGGVLLAVAAAHQT